MIYYRIGNRCVLLIVQKSKPTMNMLEIGSMCPKVSSTKGKECTFFSPEQSKGQRLALTDIPRGTLRNSCQDNVLLMSMTGQRPDDVSLSVTDTASKRHGIVQMLILLSPTQSLDVHSLACNQQHTEMLKTPKISCSASN
jgi:hypothetical protein